MNNQKTYEKIHTRKETRKIEEVRLGRKYFDISMGGSGCVLETKYGVTPKVGDEISLYLHRGMMIRGIDINGKEVFFKTQAELDKEHEEFCKKFREDNWKEWRKTLNRIKNDEPLNLRTKNSWMNGIKLTQEKI